MKYGSALSSLLLLNKSINNNIVKPTSSSSSLTILKLSNINRMSLNTSTSLSSDEIIEIVDKDNNILEPTTRKEMRKSRLIHRATYAFIRDSNNYFYVQKRSKLKDYCPNYWDPTPGGVVAAGESYEVTNIREVEEEMGISGITMNHLFTFYYEDERIKCFGDAWEGVYDGPLVLQEVEVEDVEMMSMDEIISRSQNGLEKFTPDSIFACHEYIKLVGSPSVKADKQKPQFSFK